MSDSLSALLAKLDQTSHVKTSDVSSEAREIIGFLRLDAEFFIDFFLHEQLDMEVPQLHIDVWALMTDTEKSRVLLAIPRDHAKTTLAKLGVVWHFLFTDKRFCIYLSNTNAIAKGACKDVIGYFESSNFVKIFGPIRVIKSSDNEALWIFDLSMPSGRVKRCILRGIGQGQQMRGINIDNQRPDFAVVDDVEDNDNTSSPFQQKKLDEWMFGPFIKALARNHKIVWLGNMLSKTSLLSRLSKDPTWNPVVFGSIVRNAETGELQALWEGRWTIESLMADLKAYKNLGFVETWMCEMMNMPGHSENGFSIAQINYAPIPSPDEVEAAFITIDPAFGLKSSNDETAVSVHAIVKGDMIPRTVCTAHGNWDEGTVFDETLNLAMFWNAWVWGIESVAAQKVLITLFDLLLTQRMMRGLVEIVPLTAGNKDPKSSRISAFVSLMAIGEWAIPEGDQDITNQILTYDTSKTNNKDDIIDSAAYGPQMISRYLPLIMAKAGGHSLTHSQPPKYGMEICGV